MSRELILYLFFSVIICPPGKSKREDYSRQFLKNLRNTVSTVTLLDSDDRKRVCYKEIGLCKDLRFKELIER